MHKQKNIITVALLVLVSTILLTASLAKSGTAPDFADGTWINSEPLKIQDLRGRVVLKDDSKAAGGGQQDNSKTRENAMTDKVEKTDEQWRQELSPEQYYVLRQAGTERAFTGAYWNNHDKGVYHCAACGLPLFSSATKFDSGTGWPSFYAPIDKANVIEETDRSAGMVRTEIRCRRCGSHLGHVFDDGPRPSGLRYCMNSISLKLQKDSDK